MTLVNPAKRELSIGFNSALWLKSLLTKPPTMGWPMLWLIQDLEPRSMNVNTIDEVTNDTV